MLSGMLKDGFITILFPPLLVGLGSFRFELPLLVLRNQVFYFTCLVVG